MDIPLTILFKYENVHYIGQVIKHDQQRHRHYEVFYSSFSMKDPVQTIQIYQGRGSRLRSFWRQRAHEVNFDLVSPSLVEVIGKAILLQEDIETR